MDNFQGHYNTSCEDAQGALAQKVSNLPANIHDLAKFALIGRDKLDAVRAEIRAIDKLELAQEVREQKLREGQEIAEAVLDAEVRIGELMAKVPKATKGTGSNQYAKKAENDTTVNFSKSKVDIIRDAGFTQKQVSRFQTLAAHPDIVEQAKAEARENEEIISRSKVLDKIRSDMKRKPTSEPERNEEPVQQIVTDAILAEEEESDMQAAATHESEYNIDDFIEELMLNGNECIDTIRFHIETRITLFDGASGRVSGVIDKIINDFTQLKKEVNEKWK